METTTIEKTKFRGTVQTYHHHMVRTPTTLSEFRMARPRWFDHFADHITEVHSITVWSTFGDEPKDSPFCGKYGLTEFTTPFGRGIIQCYQGGHSEPVAFIPSNGGPVLLGGAWRKKGHLVGGGTQWLRALGINPQSKKVQQTCPSTFYRAAAGK